MPAQAWRLPAPRVSPQKKENGWVLVPCALVPSSFVLLSGHTSLSTLAQGPVYRDDRVGVSCTLTDTKPIFRILVLPPDRAVICPVEDRDLFLLKERCQENLVLLFSVCGRTGSGPPKEAFHSLVKSDKFCVFGLRWTCG